MKKLLISIFSTNLVINPISLVLSCNSDNTNILPKYKMFQAVEMVVSGKEFNTQAEVVEIATQAVININGVSTNTISKPSSEEDVLFVSNAIKVEAEEDNIEKNIKTLLLKYREPILNFDGNLIWNETERIQEFNFYWIKSKLNLFKDKERTVLFEDAFVNNIGQVDYLYLPITPFDKYSDMNIHMIEGDFEEKDKTTLKYNDNKIVISSNSNSNKGTYVFEIRGNKFLYTNLILVVI